MTIAILGHDGHGKTTLAQVLGSRIAVSDPVDWTTASRDAAIVVISAPDGPMPGSRDAIMACQHHGVSRVVVFLNKCDMIAKSDTELLDLVEMEIAELCAKYGFTDSTIVRGSATKALAGDHGEAAAIGRLVQATQGASPHR